MAEPGWYPDTTMAGTQRYWDGARWTEHVAPLSRPNPAPSVTPPRRKADGSLKGPSLVTALGVIGLGVLLFVASLVVIVPAFIDSLSGPRWQVPGSYRTHLDTGEWMLYEDVTFGTFGTIGPADVEVVGPAAVVPRYVDSSETITINTTQYAGVVEFDVTTAGTYEITVRGEPSFGTEVLLARPVLAFFGNWPWFLVAAAGGVLVVVGAILWIVGGVNRGRAKRAAALGAG